MKYWNKRRSYFTAAAAVMMAALLFQFQNCGSQQSGSGLTIGAKTSASTSPGGGVPGFPSAVVVVLTPISATGVAGSTFNFSASVTGGTAPYSYKWNTGSGVSNCALNAATCAVTFPNAGSFTVSLTTTDVNNLNSSTSASVTISAILQALVGNIAPAAASAQVGVSRSFTASASGGQSPYTYSWSTVGAQQTCPAGPTCTNSYSIANIWPVTVTVRDAVGAVATATANFTVTAAPPPPPPAVCSTSVGNLESATIDGNCIITATGWGWNPNWGQGTQVRIVARYGMNGTATISGVRNDVHNSMSCVPAAPTATPGFSVSFYFGFTYGNPDPVDVTAYVLNPNGSVGATLNTVQMPIGDICSTGGFGNN